MRNCSDITRSILLAYGYTPETLAIDLDVSPTEAQRILFGKIPLQDRDICLVGQSIVGADMDFLSGTITPGMMKTEHKRRAAMQETKQSQRDAELEAKTPADPCAEYAASMVKIATVFGRIKYTGFTLEELLAEFHRQLDVWEGAA